MAEMYTHRGGGVVFLWKISAFLLHSSFARLVRGKLKAYNFSINMFFESTRPSQGTTSSGIILAFDFSESRIFQTFLYVSTVCSLTQGQRPEQRGVYCHFWKLLRSHFLGKIFCSYIIFSMQSSWLNFHPVCHPRNPCGISAVFCLS